MCSLPRSEARMNYEGYCVRVQALDGYLDKISALTLCPDYISIVAVKHLGKKKDNPHYHFVIKTQVKDQAFRVRMKKVFDMAKGNAHMSIKNWDGDIDAISYLFHEDEREEIIVLRKNISDETIAKALERNRDVQEKVEKAKERASWRLEETLYQQIITRPEQVQKSMTEWDIAHELILLALRNDKYVPNDYLLKAMASKIKFKLLKGDLNAEEKFAREYMMKVYKVQPSQWD